MTYKTKNTTLNSTVLSADIGGTNFRLAAVKVSNGNLEILHSETHSTPEISDPINFFSKIILDWQSNKKIKIDAIGIALAGPVTNQVCSMTNANLIIDGSALQKSLNLPVWLMNDLAGITWGTSLLDHSVNNIIQLGGPKLSTESKALTRRAVVAPGTGLGVGAMFESKNHQIVIDTEAGHLDFAPVNEYMRSFQAHISKTTGRAPDVEQIASGIGLENAYLNFKVRNPDYMNSIIKEIDETPQGQRGALISKYSQQDPKIGEIMTGFIEALARFTAGIALSFIPQDGLYIAGGITAKNVDLFLKDNFFFNSFCKTYKDNINQLLHTIPVFVIDDGNIGLFGAAIGCLRETQ